MKLNGEFTLTTDAATTVLLDFDGDSSIKDTGNGTYVMNPVLRVVSLE